MASPRFQVIVFVFSAIITLIFVPSHFVDIATIKRRLLLFSKEEINPTLNLRYPDCLAAFVTINTIQ